MSSEEDKMPLRRENTLAPLEKVPEELMDKVVEHAEAKRVADLSIIDRVKEGIEDVTTQISSQVESLKEAATSTDKQEENIKQTQEAPEKKESPKGQKMLNDPSLELKQKLESGEKIKASELASEFIHFIQEESRGSDDQNLKKQEQNKEGKQEHQSLVHIAEEGVKTIVRRLSQTLEDMKEKLHSSREGSATSPEEKNPHHSFKEFALEYVHEIQDELTLEYDQEYMHTTKPQGKALEKKLEKFIHHKKPLVETEAETQPLKAGEVASIHQVNPAELKGFTTVGSGKSESETKPQQEEKEAKKEEESTLLTSSKNPFDILMEDENLNVVAGEGIGTDITNKVSENESASFKDKAKGKIENLSSKILSKVHTVKSKASATFKEADKENAPQVA